MPFSCVRVFLVSGCATHSPQVLVASPPPRRGYVRVDALVARSPLQTDIARLRVTEQQLRRLARGEQGAGAAANGYSLGALRDVPPADPVAIENARRARDARSSAARARLSQNVESNLTRFAEDRAHRQQQRIDQKRTELEAVYYGHAAERQRLARDKASAQILQGIDAIANEVSVVQAKLAVLHAQLGTKNQVTGEREQGTFPPVIDAKQFKADVQSILDKPDVSFVIVPTEKDPNAKHYIGMQARLEAKRVLQHDLLEQLRDKLNKIHADAIRRADSAALAVAQQQLDDIENQLEMMSQDRNLAFQLRDLRVQLQNVLRAVAAAEDAAEGKRDSIAGKHAGSGIGGGAGAGAVRLQTLFGPTVATGDKAGAGLAADRIGHQRERLERFIYSDVETAINNAARERNVDIVQVSKRSEATGSATRPSIDGRVDMTDAFARWVEVGKDRVNPTGAESASADRPTTNPSQTPPMPRAGG